MTLFFILWKKEPNSALLNSCLQYIPIQFGNPSYIAKPQSVLDCRRALFDQACQFGKIFLNVATLHDIKVDSTGIEAHSSFGIGEQYHQPLRQTFRNIMADHEMTDRVLALPLAVKAMNDTLGAEGLVPSVIVIGQYPNLNILSSKPSSKTTQISRKMIAGTTHNEMEKPMSKMRINRALRHAVPTAANRSYGRGDQVLVWREKIVEHRIGEWLGPFSVASFQPEMKLVLIQDESGELQIHSMLFK